MEMGTRSTPLPLFSHGTLSFSNRVIDSPLSLPLSGAGLLPRTSRAFSDMQATSSPKFRVCVSLSPRVLSRTICHSIVR